MNQTYPPSKDILDNVNISEDQYEAMYKGSIEQPEIFWAVQAGRLDWYKKPTRIKNTSFTGDVSIKWYEDGILNACYNCVDRHLPAKENDIALIFEPDEWHPSPPSPSQGEGQGGGENTRGGQAITYAQLHTETCRLANALKSLGVQKGDRVIIYMPMVLEAVYAMLACARIGAIHSVVFGGFSPGALHDRILDCDAKIILTADEGVRGGKSIPLGENVRHAVKETAIETIFLLRTRLLPNPPPQKGREDAEKVALGGGHEPHYEDWQSYVSKQSPDCPCEEMNAEDPLFILYTSGSTGKPKGVLHTTGGYMVYASLTHEVVFDYKQGEVYWCTADVGWVTGHSYIVYGPLANGATSLVFEGVPNYPDWSRFWNIVDKHKVNIFYTAPTAIRALLAQGDEHVTKTSRKSLRILGTVGEPINHEAWEWYYNIVGEKRCPVIDTWWQTETGGHMITPLPCHTLKPGAAQKPFFGAKPAIVDGQGKILDGETEGNFVMLDSWPGQMRTLYGDHQRFIETYFTTFPGMYFTGDGAKRDKDGDYRITGRVDDVLNVSGHRLGTAEIEEAINEHEAVAESAIVGYPHDIKGTGIYAYVILNQGQTPSEDMEKEINKILRAQIGPIAKVDIFQFTKGLPKTRSGKIMRRILRKIACGETASLGDTSTLADPAVVDDLIKYNP